MDAELEERVENLIGSSFSWTEIARGMNSIYRLDTGDERLILKVHTNKGGEFSEGYLDDQIGRFRAEPEIYRLVNSNTDVPGPDIISSSFGDRDLYIMEDVEGENLADVREELSETEMQELMKMYGKHLRDIHDSIEMEGYGLVVMRDGFDFLESCDTWRESFRKTIQNSMDVIEKRWDQPPEMDETVKEMVSILPEQTRKTLIHSDNRLENLHVEDGEITGFLDWSFTRSGDPLYDLARAEYMMIDYELVLDGTPEEERERLREALIEGYNPEVERYRERRQLYRYATVLWIMAGFPNWSSDWEEDRRRKFRQRLLDMMDEERP